MSEETKSIPFNQQYCDNHNFFVYRNVMQNWEEDPDNVADLATTLEYNKKDYPINQYLEPSGCPDVKILWVGLWLWRAYKNPNWKCWYHYLDDIRSFSSFKDKTIVEFLRKHTVYKLKQLAGHLKIPRYSSMRKEQLIESLSKVI